MVDPKKIAGLGDAAVRKATGKDWQQWLTLLDRLGARDMAHKSIAELLSVQHRLDSWWAQMIAVGYEQSRGLRQVLERADGFAAQISRTVNTRLGVLYDAFEQEAARLEKEGIRVRRSRNGRTLRAKLDDGSQLEVALAATGDKSEVRVEHRGLKTAKQAKETKAFWKLTLDELQQRLSKLG